MQVWQADGEGLESWSESEWLLWVPIHYFTHNRLSDRSQIPSTPEGSLQNSWCHPEGRRGMAH